MNPHEPFTRDADVVEGQAAFAGTRIPVWVLFNYLTDERALAAFRAAYPQIPRASLLAVLDQACLLLTGQDGHGEEGARPHGRRRAS